MFTYVGLADMGFSDGFHDGKRDRTRDENRDGNPHRERDCEKTIAGDDHLLVTTITIALEIAIEITIATKKVIV